MYVVNGAINPSKNEWNDKSNNDQSRLSKNEGSNHPNHPKQEGDNYEQNRVERTSYSNNKCRIENNSSGIFILV